jgi:hypothetical protein
MEYNNLMNDDKLIDVAATVDNFLMNMVLEHKIDPLSLASVILARLVLMAQETECDDEFKRVLSLAQSKERKERVLQ